MWILFFFAFLGFSVTLIMTFKDRISNGTQSNHSIFEILFLGLFSLFVVTNVFLPVRVASVSSMILAVGASVSVVFILFRVIRGFRLTTSFSLTIIAGVLYHATAIAWVTCEQECCAKTYGLLIYMDKDLSQMSLEILKSSILKN